MEKIALSKVVLEQVELDKTNCVNCKKCFSVCPMMKEYGDSPKEILEIVLSEKSVNKNIPYSCMLCNVCTTSCPKDIDLKSLFYNMRKDIKSHNSKELKDIGYDKIKSHQKNSFSSIFSKDFIKDGSKKIFFPGCSLLSYSPHIVNKTYDYLNEHIDNLSIVFECCGKPTSDMGDIDGFKGYYSRLERLFEENDISEVIVACPNCYNTIKSNSPNVKVTLIWNVISKYGVPKYLNNHYKDVDISFSLHDPCPVRKEDEIHNNVRDILKYLGVKVVEFDNNRRNTQCCGSGGMVRVTSNEISLKQTNKRANDAKTNNIIAYCESCCESMLSSGKLALHILDFMFNEDVINKVRFTQNKVSFINKWGNRYKAKISMNKKVNTKR